MSIPWKRFVLVIVLATVGPPLCEGGEGPPAPAREAFHAGWSVVRNRDGQVLRLIAKPRQWKTEALADLKGLDSIESLDLSGTDVRDDALRALAPLQSLKTLLLARTGISDAGLAHLTPLVGLETLDLSETQVSDEGLRHLSGIAKLKTLVTHRSRVTEQGLETLESLRPDFEAVRLWDVTWEDFDHALLLETPRFDLIQDCPAASSGFKRTAQIQVSGPTWKSRSESASQTSKRKRGKKGSRTPNLAHRKPDFRIVCDFKPGSRTISTVRVGDSTLEVSNPARTYLVDGHGGIKAAEFGLRFDVRSFTWIEMPEESRGEPSRGSLAESRGGDPAPSTNTWMTGEWNGKHVWNLLDVEVCRSRPLGPRQALSLQPVGPRFHPNPQKELKYRSDAGLTLVFLHVPASNVVTLHEWEGDVLTWGVPMRIALETGLTSWVGFGVVHDGDMRNLGFCFLPQPAMNGASLNLLFTCLDFPDLTEYWPRDASPETKHFGAACSVGHQLCGSGRTAYLECRRIAIPPNPRWEEIARKQQRESDWHPRWPDLRVEKHGRELVIPACLDREKKRVELVDYLGRKHVIEEQRFDLTGPKKTMVLDVYGRLRVLSPEDAERILRTRLRDYLNDGDPSPAGPVTPVAAEGKAKPKNDG